MTLQDPAQVALHSPEWQALVNRLQNIRVQRIHLEAALRKRPSFIVGTAIAQRLDTLSSEERRIRARLPFDPSGL